MPLVRQDLQALPLRDRQEGSEPTHGGLGDLVDVWIEFELLGGFSPARGTRGRFLGKTTVWREAQEAGEALRRKRPAGRVRGLGADETVKVKGREVTVSIVVDAQSGRTLGFEVLFGGDGKAFKEWG